MTANALRLRETPLEELWLKYHSDKDVEIRNELVVRYSDLVKLIAFKTIGGFQNSFNYMDDVVSEGLIALLDAIEKFDLEKKVKFETFASVKVRGAMIDFIRRQDCFPRRVKKLAKLISDAETQLSQKLGRGPTDRELAGHMNISLEELEKWRSETCALNIFSFEEIVYERGIENIRDYSADSSSQNHAAQPEQAVGEKEFMELLAANISALDEKEQLVIALYYKEQFKIKEISDIMNISSARVSQIHSGALSKLKGQMESYVNL